MRTFASLFSGGGGADLGAQAAGYAPVWAVEHDAAIAGVYRVNLGDHVLVADVAAVDYAALPAVDWLHASPVCTRYSVANAQRGESDLDIETAQATARAIETLTPRHVTIENVPQYAASDALRLITGTLDRLGYWWHAATLNSADYGVPQTRRRLIVRASLGLLRPMPQAQRWVGWHEAIEDLLPTLPPSAFAAWQLARLPEEVRGSVLVAGLRQNIQMATIRNPHEPMATIDADDRHSHASRAFLVEGTGQGQGRAPVVSADQPAFTVRSHPAGVKPRAWLSQGRVVRMTPRALARFQAFPDSYTLPDNAALACRVIGNACPPLLMQMIGDNWSCPE